MTALAAPSGAGAASAPLTRAPLAGLFADFGCAHPATVPRDALLRQDPVPPHRGRPARPGHDDAVTGYGPADIQSAYKLAGATSGGRTVAIVDAYDDPNAEADLAAYRSHFGLPACTKANGCFKQVNQNGAASPLPSTDYGWALEISLDLDMVSAACPDCHILLVEANSATDTDLYTAVDTAAATPGVIAISNSYGGGETAADHVVRPALQPPRRRDHGEFGRQRVRRVVPGRVAVRHRRRRHQR